MSILHTFATQALSHLFDPETAHDLALKALEMGLGPVAPASDPVLATELLGMKLPNPIGLAAGFDKNARVPLAMLRAGFGFVECGTVTPKAQPGNPKPRIFRLREDQAVVNRLGFNNKGLAQFTDRLRRYKSQGVIGANVGANKDASDRVADYCEGYKAVAHHASYVTVNISSPNTPGLRDLQNPDALVELLDRLRETRAACGELRPLLLKVAPDLAEGQVADIARVLPSRVDGLIVSNTTISRPGSLRSGRKGEAGGLSGKPLFELSTAKLKEFRAALPEGFPLIGAGGISSGAEAFAKIKAGASAVQLYSAMVYAGPELPARIARDLAAILKANGFANVRQAVGTA
jgi:dihydroorotate dehydrogenase